MNSLNLASTASILSGLSRSQQSSTGRWRQFWHITFPDLRNTIIFVLIATTILSFKLYKQVVLMTQGGPENATATVVWYIVHQSIHNMRVGYASAVAVVFFLIHLKRVILVLWSIITTKERES